MSKYLNRESDGTTYWREGGGSWKGAATKLDGNPDLDNWGFISDYEIPLEDYAALIKWLREAREGT